MSAQQLDFATYCVGNLSQRMGLSQREVYNRLNRSGILHEYIIPAYDVLHTFSKDYLMDDLMNYMHSASGSFRTISTFYPIGGTSMNDSGKQTILNMKYARIIAEMAHMAQIDEAKAMDVFYNSDTMQLINDGVSDLHCRSDRYLAEEIIREYNEKNQ